MLHLLSLPWVPDRVTAPCLELARFLVCRLPLAFLPTCTLVCRGFSLQLFLYSCLPVHERNCSSMLVTGLQLEQGGSSSGPGPSVSPKNYLPHLQVPAQSLLFYLAKHCLVSLEGLCRGLPPWHSYLYSVLVQVLGI